MMKIHYNIARVAYVLHDSNSCSKNNFESSVKQLHYDINGAQKLGHNMASIGQKSNAKIRLRSSYNIVQAMLKYRSYRLQLQKRLVTELASQSCLLNSCYYGTPKLDYISAHLTTSVGPMLSIHVTWFDCGVLSNTCLTYVAEFIKTVSVR